MRNTAVVALGGNALLRRDEPFSADAQRGNARAAAASIAELAGDRRLVITHGNGPQVGLLALQSEADPTAARFPLDVIGAESEGMIGYVLEQELHNVLPDREVATLLTQVEVAHDDPAFANPTKPIGPRYDEAMARQLTSHRGWFMGRDDGGYRRLVASPAPIAVVELRTIELLLDHGVVVVCGGGGGIPVVATPRGLVGVEGVVDKDATAGLLAERLADLFVMLTDVDAVYDRYPQPGARAIRRTTPEQLRRLEFPAGSMGPKVTAACRFVERTGKPAVIGALADAEAVFAGDAGTWITPTGASLEARS